MRWHCFGARLSGLLAGLLLAGCIEDPDPPRPDMAYQDPCPPWEEVDYHDVGDACEPSVPEGWGCCYGFEISIRCDNGHWKNVCEPYCCGDPSFGWRRDMTVLAPTGAECSTPADCAPSNSGTKQAVCTKSGMFQMISVPYPGGYCQSPCLISKADPGTGLSSDCPGDTPTCLATSATGGLCVASCSSVADCRDGGDYVCANVTGTAIAGCIPKKASGCDPEGDPLPQGLKCAAGHHCMSFSPDNSYGQCVFTCDPLAQGCPEPGDVCIVDVRDANAAGTCVGCLDCQAGEGYPCQSRNSCFAGYECTGGQCRRYCKTGQACPVGRTCSKIPNAAFDESKLGVCLP